MTPKNDGERTPDRDQRIRTLRLVGGDAAHARTLWNEYHDGPAEPVVREGKVGSDDR